MPHPSHHHPHEEMMLVQTGQLAVTIAGSDQHRRARFVLSTSIPTKSTVIRSVGDRTSAIFCTGLSVTRKRKSLERNIAVLLTRHRVGLVGQHAQRANHLRPRLMRLDHIVQIPPFGRDKRIRKALAIFFNLCLPARFRIGCFLAARAGREYSPRLPGP